MTPVSLTFQEHFKVPQYLGKIGLPDSPLACTHLHHPLAWRTSREHTSIHREGLLWIREYCSCAWRQVSNTCMSPQDCDSYFAGPSLTGPRMIDQGQEAGQETATTPFQALILPFCPFPASITLLGKMATQHCTECSTRSGTMLQCPKPLHPSLILKLQRLPQLKNFTKYMVNFKENKSISKSKIFNEHIKSENLHQ